MIKIDGKEISSNKFPDGTFLLNLKVDNWDNATIEWNFENNEEALMLMFLTRHLQNYNVSYIELVMPYIPNARQDRVKYSEDVFTLKYFAEFINSLGFNKVIVFDPHSSVSEALIDNLVIDNPQRFIDDVITKIYRSINHEKLMAFYPDEGAMKRYSNMIGMPYVFGIKKREWRTGKILGLDIGGDAESIKEKNVLIIDDISSRGGTFYHSAKKLKELGAKNIYLYVSHCEETILEGEIFTSGLIDKVFTTNSIFTDKAYNHAKELGFDTKIEVLSL